MTNEKRRVATMTIEIETTATDRELSDLRQMEFNRGNECDPAIGRAYTHRDSERLLSPGYWLGTIRSVRTEWRDA